MTPRVEKVVKESAVDKLLAECAETRRKNADMREEMRATLNALPRSDVPRTFFFHRLQIDPRQASMCPAYIIIRFSVVPLARVIHSILVIVKTF